MSLNFFFLYVWSVRIYNDSPCKCTLCSYCSSYPSYVDLDPNTNGDLPPPLVLQTLPLIKSFKGDENTNSTHPRLTINDLIRDVQNYRLYEGLFILSPSVISPLSDLLLTFP